LEELPELFVNGLKVELDWQKKDRHARLKICAHWWIGAVPRSVFGGNRSEPEAFDAEWADWGDGLRPQALPPSGRTAMVQFPTATAGSKPYHYYPC
jgi:hypothetical protein